MRVKEKLKRVEDMGKMVIEGEDEEEVGVSEMGGIEKG